MIAGCVKLQAHQCLYRRCGTLSRLPASFRSRRTTFGLRSFSIWLQQQAVQASEPTPFYAPQSPFKPYYLQLPAESLRDNPEAWVASLQSHLPPQRGSVRLQDELGVAKPRLKAVDICHLLVRAREDNGLDILSYLGDVKGRWDAVAWIIESVSKEEDTFRSLQAERDSLISGIEWPALPLEDLTDVTIRVAMSPSASAVPDVSWQTGFEGNHSSQERRMQLRGLGQIWRSLGSLILKASTSPAEDSRKIMPHVLEALAVLHHNGIVADSVYHFKPAQDSAALHQPPTLHLLSSHIFAALSDATWNARITSDPVKAEGSEEPGLRSIFKSFLDQRFKLRSTDLGHEVWLELVLWACLHGEWISDGAAILQELEESRQWSLTSWKGILGSSGVEFSETALDWNQIKSLVQRRSTLPTPDARHAVERTISSEVIGAYVDGLTNLIHVSLPDNGIPLQHVLARVKSFKEMLDRQNLGLGYTTWDAICIRFLESGGFSIQNDPQTLLDILTLIQPFGRELESDNLTFARADESSSIPPYVFDASAAALGLLHRAIDSNVEYGDVEGALRAFHSLQLYTDLNKRRSLEGFFRDLKDALRAGSELPNSIFEGNLSAIEYPSFHPQIPATVLSGLLDMVTQARLFELGDFLFRSKDVDDRIIPRDSYDDPVMASALIRYATARPSRQLLHGVIHAHARINQRGLLMPPMVLKALLQSQIKRRLWPSVEHIMKTISQSGNPEWRPETLCDLACEILLLQRDVISKNPTQDPKSLATATGIFQSMAQNMHALRSVKRHDALQDFHTAQHSILGVLCSISPEWAAFCQGLSPLSGPQPLHLSVRWFDTMLAGVVDAFGLRAGKKLWETWCAPPEPRKNLLVDVPSNAPSVADDYFNPNNRVILDDVPDGPLTFQGRVQPRLSTLRIILRAILEERGNFDVDNGRLPREGDEVLPWALTLLKQMTQNEEEVERELKRLIAARSWQKSWNGSDEVDPDDQLDNSEL
jgi:hypothetical protein